MDVANIFIYSVCALMLLAFAASQVVEFIEWRKRRKEERTDKQGEITGYSRIDFTLADTPNDCYESIELRNSIGVGQVLTCMIVPSQGVHNVSVNVQWYETGIVPSKESRGIYDRIFSGNYVSCFVYDKQTDESGKDVFKCRFVFRNTKGVYDFISDFTSLKNTGSEESEAMDLSNYIVLSVTGEMVYRFRDDYVTDKDGLYPIKIREEAIEEDDYFFKRFVIDLLRGFIVNKQDKSEFMRECGKDRAFGSNKILRKRITNYLRETGVCIAD